jgi:hypothetical protein
MHHQPHQHMGSTRHHHHQQQQAHPQQVPARAYLCQQMQQQQWQVQAGARDALRAMQEVLLV